MSRDWKSLQEEFEGKINETNSLEKLEQVRIELLGKKGQINALMKEMKDLSADQRKEFGSAVKTTSYSKSN